MFGPLGPAPNGETSGNFSDAGLHQIIQPSSASLPASKGWGFSSTRISGPDSIGLDGQVWSSIFMSLVVEARKSLIHLGLRASSNAFISHLPVDVKGQEKVQSYVMCAQIRFEQRMAESGSPAFGLTLCQQIIMNQSLR